MVEGKRILILGGYGNTGRLLARLLLQESGAQIVVAGRNLEKARSIASLLNRDFNGDRVQAVYVDASNKDTLKQAYVGIDLVVVASSTTQYTGQIASAALEAGIDYLDIQYSTRKLALLKTMEADIQHAGCCFITDGGFHPGLPAFLVRYASQSYDQMFTARVGSVIKEDWKSLDVDDSTIYELLQLLNEYEMVHYKNGAWKKASMLGMSDFISMDFGGEFGKQNCAPMMLEEIRALPSMYPSLTDTGFYVGSFNWCVDWVIMPLALLAMKLWPHAALKPMARWTHWGLNTFTKPPYGTILKVETSGVKDGHTREAHIMIAHPDGYMFTAIPVTACLLQYLDGTIKKPGLWLQAHIVEPNCFMSDMQHMGIIVERLEEGKYEMESK